MGGDDYVIDGDLVFSNKRDALEFYREQYHKKKEWVGLTDEEARELCVANVPYVIDMVRALEAKLKEKNT